jgi:hypothetical protein
MMSPNLPRPARRTFRVSRTALAERLRARALARAGGHDAPGGFAVLALLVAAASWNIWS